MTRRAPLPLPLALLSRRAGRVTHAGKHGTPSLASRRARLTNLPGPICRAVTGSAQDARPTAPAGRCCLRRVYRKARRRPPAVASPACQRRMPCARRRLSRSSSAAGAACTSSQTGGCRLHQQPDWRQRSSLTTTYPPVPHRRPVRCRSTHAAPGRTELAELPLLWTRALLREKESNTRCISALAHLALRFSASRLSPLLPHAPTRSCAQRLELPRHTHWLLLAASVPPRQPLLLPAVRHARVSLQALVQRHCSLAAGETSRREGQRCLWLVAKAL